METPNQIQESSGRGSNNGTTFGRGRHQNTNQSWLHVNLSPLKSIWSLHKLHTILNTTSSTIQGHTGKCELDSHADTCVAGANFTILEFTGQVADVLPFDESFYQARKDIPIVTAATLYTNPETGEEILLVIPQLLWFGTTLPHSLINPNQLRAFGHMVNNDPTDTTRPFGVCTENNDFIPFWNDGDHWILYNFCANWWADKLLQTHLSYGWKCLGSIKHWFQFIPKGISTSLQWTTTEHSYKSSHHL